MLQLDILYTVLDPTWTVQESTKINDTNKYRHITEELLIHTLYKPDASSRPVVVCLHVM